MEQCEKERYMGRAIELAKTAMGHTSPNPMVGCVVVKNGEIISEGCHERYGEYHAERNALLKCSKDTAGAEIFVTLEPCCHHGKTPPCTDIIIEKKISKVYVGSMDPNPLVGGRGAEILRSAGIEVETGILEKECLALNEIFFHYISTGMPFVAVKYAMTLDGKICTYTGDSKWITGDKARKHVHFLRKKYTAILAGIGTVLADDPMLNCRLEGGVDPVRVICDSNLRIPLDCNIVRTAGNIRTIVAYTLDVSGRKKELQDAGVELLEISPKADLSVAEAESDGEMAVKINLSELFKRLGEMKIDSVLVEGGAQIHASIMEQGLANKVYCYVAPKIVGGMKAKTPVEGIGIELMKDARAIKNIKIDRFGDDLLVEGDFI